MMFRLMEKGRPMANYPPNPARIAGFWRKTAVRTLPRDLPGEGGQAKIKKHPFDFVFNTWFWGRQEIDYLGN